MFQLVCTSALSQNRQPLPLAFFSLRNLRKKGGVLLWPGGQPLARLSDGRGDTLSFRVLGVGAEGPSGADRARDLLGEAGLLGVRLYQLAPCRR